MLTFRKKETALDSLIDYYISHGGIIMEYETFRDSGKFTPCCYYRALKQFIELKEEIDEYIDFCERW